MEVNIEQKQWSWDNGNLQTEENYVNGKLSGLSKSWYENGQLKSETTYVDGKKTGTCIEWYESGGINSEIIFDKNKVINEKNFNVNGELVLSDVYKDNFIERTHFNSSKIEFIECLTFTSFDKFDPDIHFERFSYEPPTDGSFISPVFYNEITLQIGILKDDLFTENCIFKEMYENSKTTKSLYKKTIDDFSIVNSDKIYTCDKQIITRIIAKGIVDPEYIDFDQSYDTYQSHTYLYTFEINNSKVIAVLITINYHDFPDEVIGIDYVYMETNNITISYEKLKELIRDDEVVVYDDNHEINKLDSHIILSIEEFFECFNFENSIFNPHKQSLIYDDIESILDWSQDEIFKNKLLQEFGGNEKLLKLKDRCYENKAPSFLLLEKAQCKSNIYLKEIIHQQLICDLRKSKQHNLLQDYLLDKLKK